MTTIPIIDLSCGDDVVAADLLAAYGQVGFAGIVNHGVPADLLDDVFEASAAFHALPEAEKRKIELNRHHRGYIPLGSSTDSGSEYDTITSPNQSESFMMLGPVPSGMLCGPNQWPQLEGFRETLETYHAAMSSLGRSLIERFADALVDTRGEMLAMFDVPTAWLRLLRYPRSTPSGFGSAPHRDYGAITVLAQRGVSGLEVLDPDERWIEVAPDPDVLVVNTGEVMHRWSNGQILRTPHRVINRSGGERYSIPFFFDPNVEATIAPLACTRHTERAFSPIRFEDFVRGELQAGYDAHDPSSDA